MLEPEALAKQFQLEGVVTLAVFPSLALGGISGPLRRRSAEFLAPRAIAYPGAGSLGLPLCPGSLLRTPTPPLRGIPVQGFRCVLKQTLGIPKLMGGQPGQVFFQQRRQVL